MKLGVFKLISYGNVKLILKISVGQIVFTAPVPHDVIIANMGTSNWQQLSRKLFAFNVRATDLLILYKNILAQIVLKCQMFGRSSEVAAFITGLPPIPQALQIIYSTIQNKNPICLWYYTVMDQVRVKQMG